MHSGFSSMDRDMTKLGDMKFPDVHKSWYGAKMRNASFGYVTQLVNAHTFNMGISHKEFIFQRIKMSLTTRQGLRRASGGEVYASMWYQQYHVHRYRCPQNGGMHEQRLDQNGVQRSLQGPLHGSSPRTQLSIRIRREERSRNL